jgi:hypothetical protein
MAQGKVDVILVGADRIAANGDTANKIGTYTLAVLAKRHGVPFVVCAPLSSVDLDTKDGAAIPIEDRSAAEVTEIRGIRIAPAGTDVRNPAFDVTPAELITAIVTRRAWSSRHSPRACAPRWTGAMRGAPPIVRMRSSPRRWRPDGDRRAGSRRHAPPRRDDHRSRADPFDPGA